jgi:DNA topoisomerase-3
MPWNLYSGLFILVAFILYTIACFSTKFVTRAERIKKNTPDMRLFIAEKPSLGRAIAQFLSGPRKNGDGFIQCGDDIVTWCIGHLLELMPPEHYLSKTLQNEKGKIPWEKMPLPIIPEVWEFNAKKETGSQLRVIQKLLKDASSIVHAGDPDREGQQIVDSVLRHFGNRKPVKRIWLAALDEVSVKRALATLKDNTEYANLQLAAESRSKADWLVGMNLTISYSVAAGRSGYRGVLSVGRVQTPTLALIVKRDLEILNFRPKDYFVVKGKFNHANGAFWATWKPKEGTDGLDEEGRLLDRRIADALTAKVKGKPGQIAHFETKDGKQAPPLPFSLSSLQIAASARYGLSAQDVLNACQGLYERHKLTTYPRTDCDFLPESQLGDAPAILKAVASNNPNLGQIIQGANTKIKGKAWDDKKITAHHAIIPTGQQASLSALTPAEAKIYEMICKQFIAQFYPDRTFKDVKVEVECAGERFAAGQTTTHPGWKVVFGAADEDPDEEVDAKNTKNEPPQKLPAMNRGDDAPNTDVAVDSKKTQPPKPYNDGTLIKAMTNIHQHVEKPEVKKILKETAGIGTEATRAAIIETLLKRGFIEKKGKNLISTSNGRAFIKALPDEVTDPGLTGLFEQALGGIEHGRVTPDKFMGSLTNFVQRLTEKAKVAEISMPDSFGGSKPSSYKRGGSSGSGYKPGFKRAPSKFKKSTD